MARTLLDRVAPLLSSEHLRAYRGTTAGSGVPGAALRGAVAGLLGGAVINQLMLRGAVPEVAERLTGSNGPVAGIAVNLAIGVAIGVSYGLLFRRLGQDVTCALGWGLSYGFLWWVLGPCPAAGPARRRPGVDRDRGRRVHVGPGRPPESLQRLPRRRLPSPGGAVRGPWLARTRAEALRALRRHEELLAAALGAVLLSMLLTLLVVTLGA